MRMKIEIEVETDPTATALARALRKVASDLERDGVVLINKSAPIEPIGNGYEPTQSPIRTPHAIRLY